MCLFIARSERTKSLTEGIASALRVRLNLPPRPRDVVYDEVESNSVAVSSPGSISVSRVNGSSSSCFNPFTKK